MTTTTTSRSAAPGRRGGSRSPRPRPGLAIATLGTFEVVNGQEPVALPSGLPAQAVKYVIARGGRCHSEALMDALWPEAGLAEGRKGVRNVLARLQRAGAPVLRREGEAIRLADGVSVDALAFGSAADRVLTDRARPGAVDGARFALARYRGEFLPDDPYCEWAASPRERLRRRQVALLEVLVADARRRGEVLEAISLLEMVIEADPTDDSHHRELADLLIRTGRRGRAAATLERARTVLASFGLEPDAAWEDLRRRLAQPAPARPDRPRAAGEPPRA